MQQTNIRGHSFMPKPKRHGIIRVIKAFSNARRPGHVFRIAKVATSGTVRSITGKPKQSIPRPPITVVVPPSRMPVNKSLFIHQPRSKPRIQKSERRPKPASQIEQIHNFIVPLKPAELAKMARYTERLLRGFDRKKFGAKQAIIANIKIAQNPAESTLKKRRSRQFALTSIYTQLEIYHRELGWYRQFRDIWVLWQRNETKITALAWERNQTAKEILDTVEHIRTVKSPVGEGRINVLEQINDTINKLKTREAWLQQTLKAHQELLVGKIIKTE